MKMKMENKNKENCENFDDGLTQVNPQLFTKFEMETYAKNISEQALAEKGLIKIEDVIKIMNKLVNQSSGDISYGELKHQLQELRGSKKIK